MPMIPARMMMDFFMMWIAYFCFSAPAVGTDSMQ